MASNSSSWAQLVCNGLPSSAAALLNVFEPFLYIRCREDEPRPPLHRGQVESCWDCLDNWRVLRYPQDRLQGHSCQATDMGHCRYVFRPPLTSGFSLWSYCRRSFCCQFGQYLRTTSMVCWCLDLRDRRVTVLCLPLLGVFRTSGGAYHLMCNTDRGFNPPISIAEHAMSVRFSIVSIQTTIWHLRVPWFSSSREP